jgi:glutamyl-tRNA reductase
VLRALFRSALAAGKQVRSETKIGCNPASVPSVAISQARLSLGSLSGRTFLLVGAGAMAHTAVKALRARNHELINIANRTLAHAEELAASWGGTVYGLDDLENALVEADIAFFVTHARQPLLDQEMMEAVMARRRERTLMIFDLSAPRNVDPAAGEIAGVTLVDMDNVKAELDESLVARRQEIPAAEAIIAEETAFLNERLSELAMRPVIAGLRQKAEAIRRREVARTLRHLGDVDQETLAHINHLSQSLVNKLLHEPTIRLRREANGSRPDAVTEVVRDLFNLE